MRKIRCVFCRSLLKGAKAKCPACGQYIDDVMRNDPRYVEAFLERAVEDAVDQGKPRRDIARDLTERGFATVLFQPELDELANERRREVRREGLKEMLWGMMLGTAGILATVGTYLMASRRGGYYFITWGLILSGLGVAGRGLWVLLYRD